jgi:hypothetical protein
MNLQSELQRLDNGLFKFGDRESQSLTLVLAVHLVHAVKYYIIDS